MSSAIETELTCTYEPTHQTAEDGGHETLIEARESWLALNLGDLWTYRELLWFLVWRDVKVRYKQTVLGAAWAVLQPVLAMIIFTLIFGRLARLPSDSLPYPLFVYTGLLPWQLFAFALTESSNSLVSNQNLIRKVYFPRLIIPISSVLVGLADFSISIFVLGGMMAYYGFRPAQTSVLFLPFLLFAVITALGMGLWLSALNIRYRDVKYVVPFLAQIWMFATPVVYSSSSVPAKWRALYGLNPMTGVVNGFRWALLGKSGGSESMMLVSVAAVLVLLAGGLIYFRRMERSFADVV
ncbi:MAG TPA: ABC transporter permease [Bryobacteraceae bacterium]|jgi:lipopolysaccharide transport system permease protein